ncbi:protein DCL homolog, chloroplastic-like [Phragmites australis]|uniref:protein DCL homolog, chloroplastic-like n=1 Tax=Phragmites australis TaxID=29695 RepID=UPI002D7845A3|nr:protein DCL homolog, chloroplastic-like [Phragmites australis]XP_062221903.1 protein DCL homolog, chloroplastic-like [Phragmites australis]
MHFPSPRAHAMAVPAVTRPRLVARASLASTFCLVLRGRGRGHGRAVAAVRAREQGAAPPDPAAILRRPEVATTTSAEERESDADSSLDGPGEVEAPAEGIQGRRKAPEREWVDWEDLILEDTVPLVGFVRMILHSGKYESGDRLSPEHEKAILERLLPYHPQYEKKIGCGIDYIVVGLHPEFENSRCLFIVRKDGEQVDFSFWKCIKGLIRQKYPLYADSFILRHFRRRQDY